MSVSRPLRLAFAMAALLSGCSFTDDILSSAPDTEMPAAQSAPATPAPANQAASGTAPAPATPKPGASSFTQRYPWLPTLDAPDPRGDATPEPSVSPSAALTSPSTPPVPAAPASSAPGVTVASARPPSAASTTSVSTIAPPPALNRPVALRNELLRLQDDVAQHSSELRHLRAELDDQTGKVDALASGIETRLKSTNVPNDPQLLNDWSQAETQLNKASENILKLNNISSWATTDSALASYVLQAVRSAQGDPNIGESDRRQLARLAGEADHAALAVDQLVTETSGEIASRNLFVATAHRRLASLQSDIAAGQRASSVASLPRGSGAYTAAALTAPSSRRALVTIRFDHPNVAYEEELYWAMRTALERRPDVAFDIVAVSPPGAGASSAAASER
ncbi:MAG: hypothetical protein JO107_04935, partial [Hyphomicrobiales bacterium]|nr:hypothetical protein [Hyphomicrobiales bacterium]